MFDLVIQPGIKQIWIFKRDLKARGHENHNIRLKCYMTMEPHVSGHEASDIPENVFIKDVITSETHHVASKEPGTYWNI